MQKDVPIEFTGPLLIDLRVEDIIYVQSDIFQPVACSVECGDFIGISLAIFIPVEVQVQIGIFIDQEFDLTPKELMYMMELVGDPKDVRQQRIARYYFTMRVGIKEIADTLGISKSQVYSDIKSYRQEVLKAIKKDLRQNKKILGHMVDLMNQLDNQTRTIWDKYSQIEADVRVYRRILQTAEEQITKGGKIDNLRQVNEAMRTIFSMHDRQQQYLYLLKEQTKAMLIVWREFGLTGEDALKLVLSGGIDIDAKVMEVRQTIVKLIEIIKFEVGDKRIQRNIFGRLANEIKLKALGGPEEAENGDEPAMEASFKEM